MMHIKMQIIKQMKAVINKLIDSVLKLEKDKHTPIKPQNFAATKQNNAIKFSKRVNMTVLLTLRQ